MLEANALPSKPPPLSYYNKAFLFFLLDGISGKSGRSSVELKRYHPPPIQPNGPTSAGPAVLGSTCSSGGRRPMIPQFDMDANELMKVSFASVSEHLFLLSRNLGNSSDIFIMLLLMFFIKS